MDSFDKMGIEEFVNNNLSKIAEKAMWAEDDVQKNKDLLLENF